MISETERQETIEKLGIFVIVIITLCVMFLAYNFLGDWRTEQGIVGNDEEVMITSGSMTCLELGCPIGTDFIGSRNSDLFHECSSSHAKRINEENRICFKSASEAVAQGYKKAK